MKTIKFDSVNQAVEALRQGRLVVLVDDKERKNEASLVCAAEQTRPEHVDFMLRHGRGLLSVVLGRDWAEQLGLTPLIESDVSADVVRPALLALLDHKNSGTGVSVESRCHTIQQLANKESRAADFIQPGHVPVFAARKGGVLRRAGMAEAAVDLMRLAGFRPAAAVCEILGQHNMRMADGPEIQQLANEYELPVVSLEELIQYRIVREKLVRREVETVVPSRFGDLRLIAYSVQFEQHSPVAIVIGDLQAVEAPLVRIHRSCFGIDVVQCLRRDGRSSFHCALEQVRREGAGVVIFLGHDARGVAQRLQRLMELTERGDTKKLEEECRASSEGDSRDHMTCLQILQDMGLKRVRLLTSRPEHVKRYTWAGVGIEVEPVPMWCLRPHTEPSCLGEQAARHCLCSQPSSGSNRSSD